MSDLLQISFQAGGLAALVLLTNQLLSRWLPPKARYTLWFLVVIRLLLWTPFSDPLAMERPHWWTWQQTSGGESAVESSAPTLGRNAPHLTAGLIRIDQAQPSVSKPAEHSQGKVNATPEKQSASEAHQPTKVQSNSTEPPPQAIAPPSSKYLSAQSQLEGPKGGSTPTLGEPSAATNGPSLAASTAQSGNDESKIWYWLWLMGAITMLIRAVGNEWMLQRKLRTQSEPAPADAQALVKQCRSCFDLKHPIDVLTTNLVTSPAAYGLWKPRILLPTHGWAELNAKEREFVILHELAHLKHKDAWINWLTALLAAVHWFNPLIHLAFARLRAEREVVRDREAITARPGVEPTQYAATILKMLPRNPSPHPRSSLSAMVSDRNTTRKRINMIMKNQSFRKPHLLLGATCFALLGWVGLTQASVSVHPTSSPSNSDGIAAAMRGSEKENSSLGTEQNAVRITRQTPEPDWRPALKQALEMPVTWSKSDVELDEWADHIHETTGIRIYGNEGMLDPTYELFVPLNPMPLRVALELFCWQQPMTWSMMPDGITLAESSELFAPMDLRFYDVRPLVNGSEERAEHLINLFDDLMPMVDVWRHGSEVRHWDGQLLVKQSDDIHQRIEQTINLLLSGNNPTDRAPAAQITTAMEMPMSISDESYSAREIFEILSQQSGVQILLHDEFGEEEISLEVSDAPMKSVLDAIARRLDLRYQIWNDTICFGYQLPLETRSYAVGDLIRPSQELVDRRTEELLEEYAEETAEVIQSVLEESMLEMKWQKMDELEELIVSMVDQSSWDDVNGCRLSYWDDRIIVTQLPSAHRSIHSFLQAARRATQ